MRIQYVIQFFHGKWLYPLISIDTCWIFTEMKQWTWAQLSDNGRSCTLIIIMHLGSGNSYLCIKIHLRVCYAGSCSSLRKRRVNGYDYVEKFFSCFTCSVLPYQYALCIGCSFSENKWRHYIWSITPIWRHLLFFLLEGFHMQILNIFF